MRLIDADALLQTLSDLCCEDNNVKTRRIIDSTLHNLMPQIISDEPTVDAQPVKLGKWSEYSRNALETYIECTNCCVASRPIHLQMVTENGSGLPDYCPNCGARMEVDEDEQDQ